MLPLTKLCRYICKYKKLHTCIKTYINNYVLGYTRQYHARIVLDSISLLLHFGKLEYEFIIYGNNECAYSVFWGINRILFIEKIDKYQIRIMLNEKYYKDTNFINSIIQHEYFDQYSYIYKANLSNFTIGYTNYYKKHF